MSCETGLPRSHSGRATSEQRASDRIASSRPNRKETRVQEMDAYLRDVLTRIADHPINHIADLLPWNWQSAAPAAEAA